MEQKISVSNFKAHCLKILDNMQNNHQVITITKRNKPIAKLKPYADESISIFGSFKGRGEIKSDITERIGEQWDSENE
jgi:prevent-host-death family protein